ncbi:MAG: hypothetical protein ACTHNZ_18640 [Trinickia sp.]|jgi:hypothetical protein|uniref:hypothetical protein n=1 Tax=Trinickia sp. TaxID=2571163 RepID=UPI003F809379
MAGSVSINSGDMQKEMEQFQLQEEQFQVESMKVSNTQDMCKTVMSSRQGESSTIDTACQNLQRGAHVS